MVSGSRKVKQSPCRDIRTFRNDQKSHEFKKLLLESSYVMTLFFGQKVLTSLQTVIISLLTLLTWVRQFIMSLYGEHRYHNVVNSMTRIRRVRRLMKTVWRLSWPKKKGRHIKNFTLKFLHSWHYLFENSYVTVCHVIEFSLTGMANPPSSPTFAASWPYWANQLHS